MPRLHYLSEQHAHDLVTSLTEQVFPDTPAFQLRGDEGRNALLSALGQPQWPYHRTLPVKAGVLHYALNKNHPFADGNKRFALTAMEVFLLLNRAVLLANHSEAEAFALGVADGSLSKDESIDFVRRRTFRLGWSDRTYRRWFERLPQDEQLIVSAELGNPTGQFFNFVQRESLVRLAGDEGGC